MRIDKTVTTSAAPADVWRVATDLAGYGEWLSLHRGWDTTPPATFGQGDTFPATSSFMNTENKVEWTVDQYEEDAALSMSALAPGGDRIAFTVLVEAQGSGSSVTLAYDAESAMLKGPVVMLVKKMAGPEVEQALKKLEALAVAS